MDIGPATRVLSIVLLIESATMILPFVVSLLYGDGDAYAFLLAMVITATVGLLLYLFTTVDGKVRHREGFLIVGLGWLLISIFGCLPFWFAGTFPTFLDCFFEAVSGFTTTGATILEFVENQSHGVLFWRSFMHWLGGMGVLIFTIALLSVPDVNSLPIFRTESPGLPSDKLVPKLRQTAKILYGVYFLFTLFAVIALKIAGMGLFDAIANSFSILGTGGFSTKNTGIMDYNKPIFEIIIMVFMFLAGINFSLHYAALKGNIMNLMKDREFRFYFLIIMFAILLLTTNIKGVMYRSLTEAIRKASFQVVSIISTTGFATADYNQWPDLSKIVLLLLMFIGGCSASTAGGIKHIRILVAVKVIKREFYKLIHPNAIMPVQIGDKLISEDIIQNTMSFILLYMLIFACGSIFLITQGMDILSGTSAVAACLGNVGPGFGSVGPTMNYSDLTALAKAFLAVIMILGRLEIYAIIIFFLPTFWKK